MFRRLRGARVILLVPALAAGLFWGIAGGATWVAASLGGGSDRATWASWLTLPVVLPATLIAAVFLLAGKFAVPLALASLMIESDADPIDSLSRGYEYTLRRPLQLVLFAIVAVSDLSSRGDRVDWFVAYRSKSSAVIRTDSPGALAMPVDPARGHRRDAGVVDVRRHLFTATTIRERSGSRRHCD